MDGCVAALCVLTVVGGTECINVTQWLVVLVSHDCVKGEHFIYTLRLHA